MRRHPISVLIGAGFALLIGFFIIILQRFGFSFEVSAITALVVFFVGFAVWLVLWIRSIRRDAKKISAGYSELARDVEKLGRELDDLEKEMNRDNSLYISADERTSSVCEKCGSVRQNKDLYCPKCGAPPAFAGQAKGTVFLSSGRIVPVGLAVVLVGSLLFLLGMRMMRDIGNPFFLIFGTAIIFVGGVIFVRYFQLRRTLRSSAPVHSDSRQCPFCFRITAEDESFCVTCGKRIN